MNGYSAFLPSLAVAAFLMAGTVTVHAQPAPAQQHGGHSAHHMHGHGGTMGGMPFEHVEGRLAFLKTELKITPAQETQWGKFADAVRSVAQSARRMHEQTMQGGGGGHGGMMRGGGQAVSAAERLDRYERMLTVRLEAVRTVRAAFDPLYASLSEEQKKTADELMSGPMSVM